jgi:hypothetical protein
MQETTKTAAGFVPQRAVTSSTGARENAAEGFEPIASAPQEYGDVFIVMLLMLLREQWRDNESVTSVM